VAINRHAEPSVERFCPMALISGVGWVGSGHGKQRHLLFREHRPSPKRPGSCVARPCTQFSDHGLIAKLQGHSTARAIARKYGANFERDRALLKASGAAQTADAIAKATLNCWRSHGLTVVRVSMA
jgi:hypothetical protein